MIWFQCWWEENFSSFFFLWQTSLSLPLQYKGERKIELTCWFRARTKHFNSTLFFPSLSSIPAASRLSENMYWSNNVWRVCIREGLMGSGLGKKSTSKEAMDKRLGYSRESKKVTILRDYLSITSSRSLCLWWSAAATTSKCNGSCTNQSKGREFRFFELKSWDHRDHHCRICWISVRNHPMWKIWRIYQRIIVYWWLRLVSLRKIRFDRWKDLP